VGSEQVAARLADGVARGSGAVKKGRHRRYEEARRAKRGVPVGLLRCEECGGDAVHGHASWCRAEVDEEEWTEVVAEAPDSADEDH